MSDQRDRNQTDFGRPCREADTQGQSEDRSEG